MNKLFTLLEKNNTNEFHLFESQKDIQNQCIPNGVKSICGKMTLREKKSTKFTCHDEDKARVRCAIIGKDVCGTCVSHLYSN